MNDQYLLDDARPVQSLKKAAANPGAVRAFRVQNKGADLPEALRAMRDLEVLVLRGTELCRWPAWISELSSLRALDLGGCAPELFTAASFEALAALPRLEEIVANFVVVRDPAAIGRLSGLRRLRLQNAQLEAIPDAWSALSSLAVLDLCDNRITRIPEAIRDLPLEVLVLANNGVRELPAWLVASDRLQRISVEWNQIEDVPPIPPTAGLSRLDLFGNPIPPARVKALVEALPSCRIGFPFPAPAPEPPAPEPPAPPAAVRIHGLPDVAPASPWPRPALDVRAIHRLEPMVVAGPHIVAPPTWSADGRWLALAEPARVLVADAATFAHGETPALTCVVETEEEITTIGFAGARLLVISFSKGFLQAIDLERRVVAWQTEPDGSRFEWLEFACGQAPPRVATVHEREVRVRGEDGSLVATLPYRGVIKRVELHPSGHVLVERAADTLLVFRIEPEPALVYEGPESALGAFDPSGAGLGIGNWSDLTLVDLSGTPRATRRHHDLVHHDQLQQIVQSPDGRFLASVCADGAVGLWSTRDLEPVRVLGGGGALLWRASFDPQGAMISTFGAGGKVEVWAPAPEVTVAAPERPLRIFRAVGRPEGSEGVFFDVVVHTPSAVRLSWGLVVSHPSRLREARRLLVQPPPGEYRLCIAFARDRRPAGERRSLVEDRDAVVPVAMLLARDGRNALDRVTSFRPATRVDGGHAVEIVDRRLCLLDAALAVECTGDAEHHRRARAEVESQWDELGWVHYESGLRADELTLDRGRIIGIGIDVRDGVYPACWGLSEDGGPICLLIDLSASG